MYIKVKNNKIEMVSTLPFDEAVEVETNQSIINNPSNYYVENGIINELDYPHAGRNIRVELTDAQITNIILNEQTRPLMEWAYYVPNRKTGNGLILWFVDFINALMSEQDTEFLLKSLGAIITRKS